MHNEIQSPIHIKLYKINTKNKYITKNKSFINQLLSTQKLRSLKFELELVDPQPNCKYTKSLFYLASVVMRLKIKTYICTNRLTNINSK